MPKHFAFKQPTFTQHYSFSAGAINKKDVFNTLVFINHAQWRNLVEGGGGGGGGWIVPFESQMTFVFPPPYQCWWKGGGGWIVINKDEAPRSSDICIPPPPPYQCNYNGEGSTQSEINPIYAFNVVLVSQAIAETWISQLESWQEIFHTPSKTAEAIMIKLEQVPTSNTILFENNIDVKRLHYVLVIQVSLDWPCLLLNYMIQEGFYGWVILI